jgi:ABC-type multidrug transport system ATPase subunit
MAEVETQMGKMELLVLDIMSLEKGNQLPWGQILKSLDMAPEMFDQDLEESIPDTIMMGAFRKLESLDSLEFRTFVDLMEQLLSHTESLSFESLAVLLNGYRLVSGRGGFFISSRSYPLTQEFFNAVASTDQLLEQIEVLRSQLVDQLRGGPGIPPDLAISERLLELLIFHCVYDVTEDSDREVYNVLIRQARTMFDGLSFQQVMRLCRNIHDLLDENHLWRLLIVQQVRGEMSHAIAYDTVDSLVQMKDRMVVVDPMAEQIYLHVIQSGGITPEELKKLIFLRAKDPFVALEGLGIHSVEKPLTLWAGSDGWSDSGEGVPLNLSMESDDQLRLRMSHQEKSGDSELNRTIASGEEEVVDRTSIFFRSDIKAILHCPLVDSGLHVSHIDLHFRGNHILKDVSMSVRKGQMVALVGPSGCGKSTMLTMLAGMLDRTGGDIIFEGKTINGLEEFSSMCTYIPQDDILFRELTVHESIVNSLKLKVQGDEEEYQSRLRSTIDVLGLERTEFLQIGNEGEKGISGGQRKRVNIGTTIVADMKPILLFDEPTSGLDPATDVEIMQLLRRLSRQGHIVIVVTHNLSAESLEYFDQLMVLDKIGRLQYYGKEKRARYFFNIRSTHLLFQKMKEDSKEDYCEKFSKTPEFARLTEGVKRAEELSTKVTRTPSEEGEDLERRPGALSNLGQFLTREVKRKSRDKVFLLMCCIQPLLIGAFISWNFDGPIPNAIFSLMAATLWIGAISGVREINTEIPQLKRDFLYGTSLGAYLGSKVLSCFGFSAFQVVLLALILFFTEGYLAAPFDFGLMGSLGSLLLLNLFGIALGLFMSAAIKSALAAVGLLPVLLIPLLIMGGALIRHNHVQGSQWWVMMVNPLRVSFESFLFSGDAILRPSLEEREARAPKDLEEQLVEWKSYQQDLTLFEKDPEAYAQKGKEEDLNDLFSDFLEEEKEQVNEGPSVPLSVVEPELLEFRPDLWLQGQSLLPVDGRGLSWSSMEKYPIRAPKAFSEELSAQGATGMFYKDDDGEVSVYRPIEYLLITLGEVLLLLGSMYLILLTKLSRKN